MSLSEPTSVLLDKFPLSTADDSDIGISSFKCLLGHFGKLVKIALAELQQPVVISRNAEMKRELTPQKKCPGLDKRTIYDASDL